jgi:hypothetical protein
VFDAVCVGNIRSKALLLHSVHLAVCALILWSVAARRACSQFAGYSLWVYLTMLYQLHRLYNLEWHDCLSEELRCTKLRTTTLSECAKSRRMLG